MSRKRPRQTGMQDKPSGTDQCQHRGSRGRCKNFALVNGLCLTCATAPARDNQVITKRAENMTMAKANQHGTSSNIGPTSLDAGQREALQAYIVANPDQPQPAPFAHGYPPVQDWLDAQAAEQQQPAEVVQQEVVDQPAEVGQPDVIPGQPDIAS